MRSLQEKYNAIQEGNFSKSQFVRDAKIEVPQFLSPYNGYEDTVAILKNKGMLSEQVPSYKAEKNPEYEQPAANYSIETLERGVDYELEKMGLMSNESISDNDYAKAKKKAEKNLEKDVNYYLHILAGDNNPYPDPTQDSHDREVEVDQKKLFKGTVDPKGGKAEGNTDTFNAMKKANLNEQKELLKESIIEVISTIEKKYPEVSKKDIKDFIKVHFKDIQAGADPVEEFEAYLDANPEILNQNLEESLETSDIKEAVKKVIKHILAEGALDRFNDYEPEISNRTNTIQDILGELEQELETNIDIINGQIRKTGGAMSPAIQDATKKDIMDLVKMYVNKITYVKSEPVDIDGKKMYRISGAEPLNERVATLDNFISLIQDKAEDSGFEEGEEAIEVIEAIADHYGIKIQVGGFVGESTKTK